MSTMSIIVSVIFLLPGYHALQYLSHLEDVSVGQQMILLILSKSFPSIIPTRWILDEQLIGIAPSSAPHT